MIKLFNSTSELEAAFQKSTIRRLRIGDKVFCLIKYKEAYHLVDGLCPHQKQPLHTGQLNAFGEIICPLHFYRFNLSTGKEANHLCRDLEMFQLKIDSSGVYAKFRQ